MNESRQEYIEKRRQLVNAHGEDSAEVNRLDSLRAQELNAGNFANPTVDNSAQAVQGGAPRQPTFGYSDSEVNEARWFEEQMGQAKAEGKYVARRNHFNDPENH